MTMSGLIIAFGVAILLAALWRKKASIEILNSTGNIITGDAKGNVTQTYHSGVCEPKKKEGRGDPVVWVLPSPA
jgi:hypothetical protein